MAPVVQQGKPSSSPPSESRQQTGPIPSEDEVDDPAGQKLAQDRIKDDFIIDDKGSQQIDEKIDAEQHFSRAPVFPFRDQQGRDDHPPARRPGTDQ